MERSEIVKLLATASAIYQNFDTNTERAKVWNDAIGHIPYEQAARAMQVYVQTERFAPTPSDIIKLAEHFKPNPRMGPDAAWNIVIKAAASFGFTNADRAREYIKKESGEVAYEAARQTGWQRICQADIEKELPFVRRDFLRVYSDVLGTTETRERLNKGTEPWIRNTSIKQIKAV